MVSPEDEMRKMLTEKDDCIKSLEIKIKNKNIIIQKCTIVLHILTLY